MATKADTGEEDEVQYLYQDEDVRIDIDVYGDEEEKQIRPSVLMSKNTPNKESKVVKSKQYQDVVKNELNYSSKTNVIKVGIGKNKEKDPTFCVIKNQASNQAAIKHFWLTYNHIDEDSQTTELKIDNEIDLIKAINNCRKLNKSVDPQELLCLVEPL